MSTQPFTPEHATDLTQALNRLSAAIERFTREGLLPDDKPLPQALAYRWQSGSGLFVQGRLVPVDSPQLISFSDLRNIDRQAERLYQNTKQFVQGHPSNNVLMTGARGTGKSSLVRACLAAFHPEGLRLIEVEKQSLDDLPRIVNLIRDDAKRYLIFCDDLSFEEGEHGYKGLKTVLDGSVAGPSPNVLVYATSNRRHMVSERMSDNLEQRNDDQGEIHPGDSIEEKISLSDRFGLHLQFYSFSQDEYLHAVEHWLGHFGLDLHSNEEIRAESLQWATQRGTRSGRVAWQFACEYAGRKMTEGKRV
ncbi:ATP-binding protein [Pseudomonas panipatensis]|uniref:ATP-binding protein n=1 Tax=Pseudomonas panipatensis TaxID=428992 RepID=UPI0035B3BFDF